jgi:uncharacterized protein with ParB-like and HNH nuclease domain
MADSTLDTGQKYVKEIFYPERFYNIPEYQRPYVWGAEQVSTMCTDLAAALAHDKNREYFLGCMIWNGKVDPNQGNPYPYSDILDGQQRFITLYLLHAVIRDLSTNPNVKSQVAKRLQQEGNDLENIPERNRLQFSIRQDDEFFHQFVLAEQGTRQAAKLAELVDNPAATTSVRNMAAALHTLHEWWASQFKDFSAEEAFQKYLYEFLAYLSNRVLVLYLATSDNLDDALNLFTVLNSRGLQLQASDILRAQNLRAIDEEIIRKKYATRWDKYQSAVEGHYNSFDDFLWTMITILVKYSSGENLGNIGKSFDFIYKMGLLKKGAATFDFMGQYVQHLQAVSTANYQAEEYGCLYENLNYILSNTFGNKYLVVLMHYRACFGEVNILEFLLKVDNLFSAIWLTSSFSITTRIFILLRRMEELRDSQLDKQVASLAFLHDAVLRYDYQDDKASTHIDLDKFFQLLDEEQWGRFSGTRINKTRYLLLKLDLLTGNLNNKLYLNKAQASLEHILPQNPKAPAWQVSEEHHAEWLHRLGNVVLVDTKKNASLSNSSFLDKRHKYSTYIEGRANTNYVFITYQHWDEPTLKQNHARVVNLLKAYYTGNSLHTLKELRKKALSIPAAVPA